MRGTRLLRFLTTLTSATALLFAAAAVAPARAQDAPGSGEQFAPGVLTTIPPELDRADAMSVHDVVELRANQELDWQPSEWLTWDSATAAPTNRTLFEMAQNAAFPHNVWCLEIAFKPLRMIEVDVPQNSGRIQRKQIWYLVYRVRNTGAGIVGEVRDDASFETVDAPSGPVRFIPQFVLASQERQGEAPAVRKAYLDRVVPAAMAAIRRREMRGGTELLNSVEIAQQDLPVEDGRTVRGAWGVAMWEDVDPELDFFSVYVGGLTNAYKWSDAPGAFATGDAIGKGRSWARKKLQLNFWRPGDAIDPNEREILFGVAPGEAALYGAGEGVAYQWVYR
jgi:hypothetical protein